jgi:hypothetical protein
MKHRTSRAGYTLVEIILAIGLLTILSLNVIWVTRAVSRSSGNGTSNAILEDQAQSVLRRVALAIMRSNRDTLLGALESPLSSDELRYQVQIGVQDGEIVWDDPEMVGFEDEQGQVFWSQNPDTAEEMRIVWSNYVAPLLEGEEMNGVDDNGNGLVDEKGLNFVIDRNAVTVRLTMERTNSEGETLTHSVETTVTCRNPGGAGP